MKNYFTLITLPVVIFFAAHSASAQSLADEVVVVFNKKSAASEDVAMHYGKARNVPVKQIIGLDLSEAEEISRAEYERTLAKPLAKELEKRKLWRMGKVTWPITNATDLREVRVPVETKFRYLVLCYGVPLKIANDPTMNEPGVESAKPELRFNGAAVDSELAALPLPAEVNNRFGLLRHINYTTTNAAMLSPTNGILLVTRLDGPTPEIAKGLVDKAMEAETNGLWGRVYCDIRNVTDTNYVIGDTWIRGAFDICRVLGFDGVIETNATTFPAGFPMSHIAFYAGWYDSSASGPFTQPNVEFMPGAFAYHLHSANAWTIRNANKAWVGPLLAKGATCTFGSVNEPYLPGTVDIGTFAARWFITGMSFGEAAYAAQSCLSWQTTVIGDPLYRPFATPPQMLHLRHEKLRSPQLEWTHLRVVNLNIVKGTPLLQVIAYLEGLALTKRSAILSEKLGDLDAAIVKPASTLRAYESALKLAESPLQKVRLHLKIAGQHFQHKRFAESAATYRALLEKFPDYPGKSELEARIAELEKPVAPPEAVKPESTNAPVLPAGTNGVK